MRQFLKHNAYLPGQSMVEVLVALSAAVIIVSSITVAVITSVNNTSYSTNQSRAVQLAQEGLDYVRQLRDTDHASFAALAGEKCLGDISSALADPATCANKPNIDSYIRTISFLKDTQKCGSGLTEVHANVAWTDSKCTSANPYCHAIQLVSCLSQTISSTQ